MPRTKQPPKRQPKRQPKSNVGRAMARMNAVTHGLSARSAIVLPGESDEEWEAFRDGILESAAPVGAYEESWALRIAEIFWRLQRVARAERVAVEVACERAPLELAIKRMYKDVKTVQDAEFHRDEMTRVFDLLSNITRVPPATPVATADAEYILTELASLYLDEDEEVDLDAFLDGVDPAFDEDASWTAGRMVATLRAIAVRGGAADFAAAFELMVRRMERVVSGAELEAADVRDELDRMVRERSMPVGVKFDRIIRNETALNRQLHQAASQLEALQARRRGEQTPLLRMQAYGGSS